MGRREGTAVSRTRRVAWIVLAVCLACSACAPKEGVAVKKAFPRPAYVPKDGRWEPIAELCDEFESPALDPAKWHPNNPSWKGRQPGWFYTKNVAVRDGKLHLTMKHETLEGLPKGYHTYTSAAVKSKAKVCYGYFEIKCRAMDSKGSSAFWFYDGTPEIWTEIDMFEMGAGHPNHERTVHMNAHVFHTLVNPDRHWAKGGKWQAPWRLADGFHVYALEWAPEELRYSVDGTIVHRLKNTHWHQPLTLNFDSETMPKWFGLPDPGTLPSTFSIEYVRSWRRVEPPLPVVVRSCTFEFPGATAATVGGKRMTYRLKAEGEGSVLVVARFARDGRKSRVHLEYENAAYFQARTAPTIRRRVVVKDTKGREMAFAFRWKKVKGEKRHNGYRAEWVDIEPAAKPTRGGEQVYDFTADGGRRVRMTLTY